jgi:hypothetical protein
MLTARNGHRSTRNLTTPRARIATVFIREEEAGKLFRFRLRHKRPNAAHHAPASPIEIDDITRVAGRVHALVRPPTGAGLKPSAYQARAFRRSNARHQRARQTIEGT